MKSRLRHPIRAIREPFGKAGLIVGVIALVFAMLGGAYAATGGSGGGKATASAKAKKGPRGPKGPAGPPGATGPAGPAGPAGAKGDTGAAGSNGSNGSNGKSVVTGSASNTECPSVGGATVEVEGEAATKKKVCNGSPWTAGGTLPSKATETGTFAFGEYTGAAIVPISFTIPLKEPLFGGDEAEEVCFSNPPTATCQVHYINPAGKEAPTPGVEVESHPACPGNVGKPEAKPGNLCIYVGAEENVNQGGNNGVIHPPASPGVSEYPGTSTAGAFLYLTEVAGPPNGWGTWAVTAP